MVFLFSFWVVVLSGLTACSETKLAPLAQSARGDASLHPDLLGTWYFTCKLPLLDDPTKGAYRVTGELEIKKNKYIYTQIQHRDDECKERVAVFNTVQSYVPRGKMDGANGVYKWDWTRVSDEKTFVDPSLIGEANAASEFEYTDWVVNVPKSIAGKKFASDSKPGRPLGEKTFIIYKIDDGVGYFMASDAVNDGETEKTRIVGLNEKVKFLKKPSDK